MRILELGERRGHQIAAAFCGKQFVDLGAEVVRVDHPAASEPRAQAVYLHFGKRRVHLDWQSTHDRRTLADLACESDIVVSDLAPADLDALEFFALGGRRPRVRVAITPFGLSGPYRDFQATAATLLALGGYSYIIGDPAREPLSLPNHYPDHQGGLIAFAVALACWRNAKRRPDQQAAKIEVSLFECMAALHQFTLVQWEYARRIRTRQGNRFAGLAPIGLFPCADGWFGANVLPGLWRAFTEMVERPDLTDDPRYASNGARCKNIDALEAEIAEIARGWSRQEVLRRGASHRVPVGICHSLQTLLEDPHLAARGFWLEQDGVKRPGLPYRFHDAGARPEPTEPARCATFAVPGPLQGIRVVDLTHVWAGPLTTRMLADLGAEVIKIERASGRGPARVPAGGFGIYPGGDPGECPWNRSGVINKLNRNKSSVVLDLKSPRGRQLLLGLVAQADVIVDNFSAGAMPALELGFEQLCAINPRLIQLAMPGFGLSGPYRDFTAYGPTVEPMSGLTALFGYEAGVPHSSAIALPDAIAGLYGVAALMAALTRRDQTGRGALVELSQQEACVAWLGEPIVERQLSGREPERIANGHPLYAPHGCYACQGSDQWIVVACRDEDEWRALARSAGAGWELDPRFADAALRRSHRHVLDREIGAWTARHDKFGLMQRLQVAGVASGAVLDAREVMDDAQLGEREFFVELHYEEAGTHRYAGFPVKIDGQRHHGFRAGPTLGRDNAAVLGGLLDVSTAELEQLRADGVIARTPPGAPGSG